MAMVTLEQLKRVYLFGNLPDELLGKLLPLTQVQIFGDGAVVFKEGERAATVYMLLTGKIILEVEASKQMSVSVGAIKPGYTFGWSAMIPDSFYTSTAVCVEPCEVLAIDGQRFQEFIERDHTLGYRIMQGLVRALRNRLKRRTKQFLDTLRTHPDIERLMPHKDKGGAGSGVGAASG
jgi:CRP-like cAMP-binding protein